MIIYLMGRRPFQRKREKIEGVSNQVKQPRKKLDLYSVCFYVKLEKCIKRTCSNHCFPEIFKHSLAPFSQTFDDVLKFRTLKVPGQD